MPIITGHHPTNTRHCNDVSSTELDLTESGGGEGGGGGTLLSPSAATGAGRGVTRGREGGVGGVLLSPSTATGAGCGVTLESDQSVAFVSRVESKYWFDLRLNPFSATQIKQYFAIT